MVIEKAIINEGITMKYFSIIFLIFSLQCYANETVTIIDKNGDIQICKVTESGVIVCL